MKQRYKLKGWVKNIIFFLSIGAIISSLLIVNHTLINKSYSKENLSYVFRGIIEDSIPVINYTTDEIVRPYSLEDIDILINYYDKDSSKEEQEKSLIKYQNTYMPNTGILYSSNDVFDVIAVLDGTVADIVADEIMGNIITIKHTNNLTTVYYSINEVNLLIGDLVKQGDVIGSSGSNKISSSSENMLLFEVIYNGEYINPETFYNMKISDLS